MAVELIYLDLRKYGLAKPVKLEFNPNRNIIIGKNATGKSVLCRLISMIVSGKIFTEAPNRPMNIKFGLIYGQRYKLNVEVIITEAENIEAVVDSAELMGDKSPLSKWNYNLSGDCIDLKKSVSIEFKSNGRSVEWKKSKENWVKYDGHFGFILYFCIGDIFDQLNNVEAEIDNESPDEKLSRQKESMFSLAINSYSQIVFDEGLKYFESVLSEGTCELRLEMKKEKNDEDGNSLSGRNGFNVVPDMRQSVIEEMKKENTNSILFNKSHFEFIGLTQDFLGALNIQVDFSLKESSNNEGVQIKIFKGPKFIIQFNNKIIDQLGLSFGQKRLASFAHYISRKLPLVIADELVNGMHHEMICDCLEKLNGRQSFLTSQNPLLFDYLKFNSINDVQQTFIICSEVDNLIVWKNMSEEVSFEFYRSYKVGIKQVNEILMEHNLW